MRCARSLFFTVVVFGAFAWSGATAQEYSWQKPHAKVIETGDLEWAPEPFEYAPGDSVRYIDYENGDDANGGTTKQSAWKHHPWDAAARGNARACRGSHTYVFRGGVTYRGALSVPAGASARLTRDPAWGEGEARFYGSQGIEGGWQRGADHPRIPEPGKVWYIDLDFAPRNLWLVERDEITRIHLARDPNWTEPDP
ncbi:MAG: hypothetical protein PVJ27_09020, partial [Candidatus Brocadiaceae bacterium]